MNINNFVTVLLFLCLQESAFIFSRAGESCGQVHITVSSLKETYLELNWITDCDSSADSVPDHIVFTSADIRESSDGYDPLARIQFSDYPSGYYKTSIKFGQPWLPGNWDFNDTAAKADPGSHCFPYWIASIKNDAVIDSRCLAIQPTWMNDNRASLGSKNIGSLLIPGTHNSGTNERPLLLFSDFVACQDRDVWAQLVFGNRYLDFRIGYYEGEGFFINHDLIRISEVTPVLEKIRRFVELAPNEIIVVDFHRFPFPSNFTSDLHAQFVALVYEHLGQFIIPPSSGWQSGKGPTLNELWAQNRSLIISYADQATVRGNNWLWNPITQYWANTKVMNELKTHMADSIKRTQNNPVWALMAELTPQAIDIILGVNNLRQLADTTNRQVTKWFRDEWSATSNVVATDYFLGNDIIHVAIESNIK